MEAQLHAFLTMALNVGGRINTTVALAWWEKKKSLVLKKLELRETHSCFDTVEETTEKNLLSLPGIEYCSSVTKPIA